MKSPEITIKEAEKQISDREKILAGLIDKREERLAFLEKARGDKKEWREKVAQKKELEEKVAPLTQKIEVLKAEIEELKTKIEQRKNNPPRPKVVETGRSAILSKYEKELEKIHKIISEEKDKPTEARDYEMLKELDEKEALLDHLAEKTKFAIAELEDREKGLNPIKWYSVKDFSEKTKGNLSEITTWDYSDEDLLTENPEAVFIEDENRIINTGLVAWFPNGVHLKLANYKETLNVQGHFSLKDPRALYNIVAPDGKNINAKDSYLNWEEATTFFKNAGKERQEEIIAKWNSLEEADKEKIHKERLGFLKKRIDRELNEYREKTGGIDDIPTADVTIPKIDTALENLTVELEQKEGELTTAQAEADPFQKALDTVSKRIDELVATYKFKDTDLEDKPAVKPAPKPELPKGEPLFDLREKKKNEPKKEDDDEVEEEKKKTDDEKESEEDKKEKKKKEKAPEPKLENYKKFVAAFKAEHKDDGLAEIIDKLQIIPAFNDATLSEGKRMLVIQGVIDSLHERVESEARERVASPASWAKNIWGLSKITRIGKGLAKGYLSRGYKEESLINILHTGDNGKAFIGQKAAEYIKRYSDYNIEGILQADGKTVHIDYAKTLENNDNSIQAQEFNRIATEYSRIPISWSFAREASPEHFKRWQEKKLEFDRAVVNMGPIFKERARIAEEGLAQEDRIGAERRGALDASTTKRLVEFISRIAKSPDAIAELSVLKDQSGWDKVKESLLNAKNAYLNQNRIASIAFGMITRYAGGTIAAGTAIGATMVGGLPLAAIMASALAGGAVGGLFRGKKIAEQKLAQKTGQTRYQNLGQHKKDETVAVMSRIDHRMKLIKEMTQTLDSLNDNENASAIEIANTKNRLQTHLDYMNQKIARGEMIFGDKDQQYKWDLEIMFASQEADKAIAMTNALSGRSEDWVKAFEGEEAKKLGAHRNSMLRAIQNSEWEGKVDTATVLYKDARKSETKSIHGRSIRQQIERSRVTARRWQQIESAGLGALLGSAGAYVAHWIHFNHHEDPSGAIGGDEGGGATPGSHPIQHHPEAGNPNLTQEDINNSLSHVTIKKGEGMGSALLRFRHTDSFRLLEQNNPKLAGFFKGNIWDEAQKLHAFRPGNAGGDSLLVGEGSELGVSPDGDIYLINTLKPGHPQLLGHIDPQTGEFTDVPPNSEFHYRSPRHHSTSHQNHPTRPHNTEGPDDVSNVHRPHNTEGPDAVEGDINTRPHNTEGPDEIPKANRPRNVEGGPDEIRNAERGQTGNEMPNENRTNRPHNTEGPDVEQNARRPHNTEGPTTRNDASPTVKSTDNFTKSDWSRVHNISYRDMHDDLNQYFGKRNLWGEITNSGEKSLPYRSLVNRDASSIMRQFKQHGSEFKPEVQKFLKHTQALAQAHPHISPAGKFGQYVENLYKADATEFVAKNPNIDPK